MYLTLEIFWFDIDGVDKNKWHCDIRPGWITLIHPSRT